MSINQVTTLRLPDGREVAFVDWSDKPLFSTADLLAGFTDQQIDLFQYTVGDPVPKTSNIGVPRTSSDSDTNMATPGAMASTEEMFVYAIRPEIFERRLANAGGSGFDANTATDFFVNQPTPALKRLAILNFNLELVLEISQKWVVQAGLGYFNAGMGATGSGIGPVAAFTPTAPGAISLRTVATQGWPSQDAVRSLAIPAFIGGQEKWRVSLMNFGGFAVNSGQLEQEPVLQDANIIHHIRIYLDGLYKRPVA